MDGSTHAPPRDLSRAFLDANLKRLRLGERTREALEQALPQGELVVQADGTPVLHFRGALLGTPSDDLALSHAVREGPSDSAYVVFGLGLGHTARALRALTDAPILIYEPNPGLARRTLEAGPSDLGGFPIVCTPHDLTQLWEHFSGKRDNVTLINTPGYSALYQQEDQDLREAVTQLIQRQGVNDATHRLRAREWVSDVLENLDLLGAHPSFLGLAQKYTGVPAFIVGAGPSLGKNGELLAEAAQKGLVFAVNSSALVLARYGVTPQLVACLESMDLSHLLEKVPYLDQVVRAFSVTAHPRTFRTGKGPLLPLYEGLPEITGPLSKLLGGHGLAVCGSVSTLAFSLAQRMGCSPIVLVGQDLAYTGGEAYAKGSPYEGSRVNVSPDGKTLEHVRSAALSEANKTLGPREPLREVPAWGGQGNVLSTIGFSAVRSWLELAADVVHKEAPDQRVVNASEGGSRICGFDERTLADVLAELPLRLITPEQLMEAANATAPPPSRQALLDWLELQLAGAVAARRAARRVNKLSHLALGALHQNDARQVTRAFAKLELAEQALNRAVAEAPFVDAFSWAAVDGVMRASDAGHADNRESARRAVTAERSIASAIESCTRELEAKLELTRHRLLAAPPDPDHGDP